MGRILGKTSADPINKGAIESIVNELRRESEGNLEGALMKFPWTRFDHIRASFLIEKGCLRWIFPAYGIKSYGRHWHVA